MEQSYDLLFDFIGKYVDLDNGDRKEISNLLSIKQYHKGDLLIKEEQICTRLQFVISGIYRVYELRNGKDITIYFNTQNRNPFVASFISLLTKKPSNYRIECISEGQLISIAYEDWLAMYAKSHALTNFGRLMAEFNYVLAIERIESLQYKSATERYHSFLKLYEGLMNQIPHHYVASYLGITPESLSRIRKSKQMGT